METSETPKKEQAKPELQAFGRGRLLPGAYHLDLSAVKDATVKLNGQPSTFGDAYSQLIHSKIKEMPSFHLLRDRYLTEDGEIELDGDWTLRAAMRTLIRLAQQGVEPYGATWFYYDHDWSRDADETSTFFVISGSKIVSESCSFSSLEPRILKKAEEDPEAIWHSHPDFDQAWEIYWYRKFYAETVTGQLMVLRPDEPILYHYERPQTREIMREVQLVTLAKIYRLLLIVVVLLAAIAFHLPRGYLAIAAGVLVADFLWVCWTTRKVTRS